MPPLARLVATVAIALLPISVRGQASQDAGLSQGRAQAARGDFYRAALTLKDAVAQLESRPEAARELASAYACLAWAHVGMNQLAEAEDAVARALKADPAIVVTPPDFPMTVASLFERARRTAEVPPEEAGWLALKSGRPQEAVLEFQRALDALSPSAPFADGERLRAAIINAVSGMNPKPQAPPEAVRHFEKARELETAQTLLGASSPTSTAAILREFEAAARIAPWWPEALFALAQAQHSLGDLDASLSTLRLYKLADPEGRVSADRALATRPEGAASAPAPETRLGTIVLYWTPQFKGGGRPGIKCDGVRLADMAKGRMIRFTAEPGAHELTFYRGRFSARVEAGGVHYMRAAAVGFPARPEIREVPAAEGEAEIAARNVVLNEEKKTYGLTCGAGKK